MNEERSNSKVGFGERESSAKNSVRITMFLDFVLLYGARFLMSIRYASLKIFLVSSITYLVYVYFASPFNYFTGEMPYYNRFFFDSF